MKRMLLGCLAASALSLLSNQQASAWFPADIIAAVNTDTPTESAQVLRGLFQTPPSTPGGTGDAKPTAPPATLQPPTPQAPTAPQPTVQPVIENESKFSYWRTRLQQRRPFSYWDNPYGGRSQYMPYEGYP